jgi:hypothetical protein
VGPARFGSTAECVGLLDALGVTLCEVSITAAQDMAIINLLLPSWISREQMIVEDPNSVEVDMYRDLASGLTKIAREGTRPKRLAKARESLPGIVRASDYVLIAGRRRRLADVPQREDRRAIWCSWVLPSLDMPVDGILSSLVNGVSDALSAILDTNRHTRPRVEYSRSRVVGGTQVRGRTKLSLSMVPDPPGQMSVEQLLDDLCTRAEGFARTSLLEKLGAPSEASYHGDPSLICDVRIDWRERWLSATASIM